MRKEKSWLQRRRKIRNTRIFLGFVVIALFMFCIQYVIGRNKYVEGMNTEIVPETRTEINDSKKEEETTYKTRLKLPIKYICQYPEMPTGCEATALTMVLNYLGFDVEKETIAADYVKKTDYPGDFIHYFMGDPFSEKGYGMYSPALTNTANDFLESRNSDLKAYDITGEGMDKICEYVSRGMPVCIWTTYYLERDPKVTKEYTLNGKDYQWKSNEHCMVVIGYDLEKDTLILANPAEEIKEYPRNLIEKRNRQFDEMAVVIQ